MRDLTLRKLTIIVIILIVFTTTIYLKRRGNSQPAKHRRGRRKHVSEVVPESKPKMEPKVIDDIDHWDIDSLKKETKRLQDETERLRREGMLPSQIRARSIKEPSSDELDCIRKLKELGYTITRKEVINVTEEQTVMRKY